MKYANFLIENWYLFAVPAAVVIWAAVVAVRFFTLPSAEQRKKVKEWLLLAVTEAERELGSGTGAIAGRIPFETFSYWVDKALAEMREMLNSNKAICRMVKNEEGAANGSD